MLNEIVTLDPTPPVIRRERMGKWKRIRAENGRELNV